MHSLRLTWFNVKSVVKKRKRVVLFGVLSVFVIWFIFSERTSQIKKEANIFTAVPCSDDDSKEVIEIICSLYNQKEIVGDLCEPLCNNRLVTFVQCLNYKHGKHVIQVECNEVCKPHVVVNAVLKMTHVNVSNIQKHFKEIDRKLLFSMHLQDKFDAMGLHDYSISARSLSLIVQDLLEIEYGFTPREGQDMLSLLWNDNYASHFVGENSNLVFARSLWSVVQQNEYRISKVLSDWNVFPKIYGSCGSLYLAESAPGLRTFNKFFSYFDSGYPSWSSRANTAMAILHLVQMMETMEHPLHLCDVKSPHFGFTPENSVKFIDADTVFTDMALSRDLGASPCSQHEDCAFFDCDGWCQKEVGKCSPLRTNNNLQMVCSKIFRSSLFSTHGGLLASPPSSIAEKLTNLVDSCADDVTNLYKGEIKIRKPDLGLLSTLSGYLLESLKIES